MLAPVPFMNGGAAKAASAHKLCYGLRLIAANSNLWLSAAPVNMASGPSAWFSCWTRMPATPVAHNIFYMSTNRIVVEITAAGTLHLVFRNSGGTIIGEWTSTNAYPVGDNLWHHLCWSIWLTYAPATEGLVYLDGVKMPGTWTTWTTNGTIHVDTAAGGWRVGMNGSGKLNWDLAEMMLEVNWFLDLSDPVQLEKLRTSDGYPADVGATGTLPSGHVVDSYHTTPNPGGSAADYRVNRGDCGAWTQNGTSSLSTDPQPGPTLAAGNIHAGIDQPMTDEEVVSAGVQPA